MLETTNKNLNFTPATVADLEAIVKLVESVYRGEHSKKGWTTEADIIDGRRTDLKMLQDIANTPHNLFLTANDGEKLVASVQLELIQTGDGDRFGYLGMFAIDVNYQGQQLGRRFLEYAENFMKTEWQVKTVKISVIQLRTELISWYERRGYKLTGKSEAFPSDPRFGIPKVPHLELLEMKKSIP